MCGSYAKRRGWAAASLAAIFFVAPAVTFATYDANLTGIADSVYTYPSGLVLIHLANQPASHPSCNAGYFAVDPGSMDANAMNRMFARLMTAYAVQQPINIGYDSQGDCTDGYIHVWRIG